MLRLSKLLWHNTGLIKDAHLSNYLTGHMVDYFLQ